MSLEVVICIQVDAMTFARRMDLLVMTMTISRRRMYAMPVFAKVWRLVKRMKFQGMKSQLGRPQPRCPLIGVPRLKCADARVIISQLKT